jgi:hypothetical protein
LFGSRPNGGELCKYLVVTVRGEMLRGVGGRCEQTDGAGLRDSLGATVRAELDEHVADVRADGGHRHRKFAGDRLEQVGVR